MKVQLFAAAIGFASFTLCAPPTFALPSNASEPHTAAAVEAVDRAWGDAEDAGNTAYLQWILLPGYRTVSPTGLIHDKAKVVAAAAANTEHKAKVAAWRASHPEVKPTVTISGDTAVLTWVSSSPEVTILGCDVFAYADGHWHAVYS